MLTDSRDIIRRLEREGWKFVRSKGSHRQFKHPAKVGRVTVALPNKNILLKTVADIYRQAGWTKD
jgi:predicted RNA binding protein YcfA (HicA-like mRNA interferase family)